MRPSEVRRRVLEDHGGLRADLDRIEALAREADESRVAGVTDQLRREAQRILERLRMHMEWEEQHLVPALRAADAWGEERVAQLLADHREQREILDLIVKRLRDPERPDALIAEDVSDWVAYLREDMQQEEHDLLDERVLRDDVISVNLEAG